jgi:hypothetical protein
VSAYLVVALSVLAAATATLTLNLLARLDWRQARARLRPAAADTHPSPRGCWRPARAPAAA